MVKSHGNNFIPLELCLLKISRPNYAINLIITWGSPFSLVYYEWEVTI